MNTNDIKSIRETMVHSLDGQPVIDGEITSVTASTMTGTKLFESGTPPNATFDGIQDWRDRALLRILGLLMNDASPNPDVERSADDVPCPKQTTKEHKKVLISPRDLLTTAEAAEYLRHSTTWLLKQNDIPYVRGTPNIYKRIDLDDWLKRHTLKPMGV